MKRRFLKLLLSGMALISGALLISSCLFGPKETLETICNNKWSTVESTYDEFVLDMTPSSCEDFKEAWEDYVDACVSSPYYNAAFENAFNDLDCSIYAK